MNVLPPRLIPLCRAACAALVLPCAVPAAPAPASAHGTVPAIQAADLLQHVQVLASDDFEGRAPGTRGEELSVSYLVREFQRFGLRPGNPDGTYLQSVPLLGSTAQDVQVSWSGHGKSAALAFPGETVVWTKRAVPQIALTNSEMLFVGYGVTAPEYGWDDFKGQDVRGKTLVFLIGDPPVPSAEDPTRLDEAMFKGRAMTYYGRWTYKYEMAARLGAAGALIVHETGPAGYPWVVVVGSNSRENFDLASPDGNRGRVQVEGWITLTRARELCAAAGRDWDQLKAAALRRDFRPMPLGTRVNIQLGNALRPVASRNVVARLEGSDPQRRHEHILYTAHWDHLGRNPALEGDPIFNGAKDNATGVGALLEIAEAFARGGKAPRRSLLFLAVTAEEKGLLGAKHYAQRPLHPLADTLANLNLDSMNPWGLTRDVNVIGYGQTTLEDVLRAAAARERRVLTPDSEPEKGYYFRSDHFEFAKVGVPGLYLQSGSEFVGRPPGFGPGKFADYTANDYHKVSDEVRADWDLSGAAADARLYFEVGREVADHDEVPAWKPGSEFLPLRPTRKTPAP